MSTTKKAKPTLAWKLLARDPADESDIVTWRAKVPGGWLVSVWGARDKPNATGTERLGGTNWGGGVTFVPGEEWDVKLETEAEAPTPKRKSKR